MRTLVAITASLILLTGCASYGEIVVTGASKGDVIRQLTMHPGRDFAQLYFDVETKIEVLVPINTQSAAFSDPDVPSQILVFGDVNRPSRCRSSMRANEHPSYCYFAEHIGDGQLLRAFSLEELAARYNSGDTSAEGVLAAAESYYARRDAFIKALMSGGMRYSRAKTNWDIRQHERAWDELYQYYRVQSFYYFKRCGERSDRINALLCRNDSIGKKFSELDLEDSSFYPFWSRAWAANAGRANAVSTLSSGQLHSASTTKSAESSNFSDSFSSAMGEVIGQAIGLWLLKEVGLESPTYLRGVSDEELKKIERAARDGARRVERQKKVQKNLNDLLKP